MSETYNIAFLRLDNTDPRQNDTKHFFEAGMGFNIFSSVPLSVQLVVDEDGNMGFSIFSSIIARY